MRLSAIEVVDYIAKIGAKMSINLIKHKWQVGLTNKRVWIFRSKLLVSENPDEVEVNQEQKVPFRILERRIQSFTQTTVPHDVNRLRQHKENIVAYHKDCNWTKLNVEQVNASRTVQVFLLLFSVFF